MSAIVTFRVTGKNQTAEIPVERIAYIQSQGLKKRKSEDYPPHTLIAIAGQPNKQGWAELTGLSVSAKAEIVLKAIKKVAKTTFMRVKNFDGFCNGNIGSGCESHTAYVNPIVVDDIEPEADVCFPQRHPAQIVHFRPAYSPLPSYPTVLVTENLDFDFVFINETDKKALESARKRIWKSASAHTALADCKI